LSPVRGVAFLFVLLALLVLYPISPLLDRGRAQDAPGEDPAPAGGKDGEKKEASDPAAKPLSIDESYVRDNLERYLLPTKVQFEKDGRVRLTFDFAEKRKEHETIFKPAVQQPVNSKFRWTVRGEEWHYNGAYNEETKTYQYGGLRISDSGVALLNAWFTDDVEAEIVYHQGTSFAAGNLAALVFCNEGGDALGSNFGSQAAIYKKGKPSARRQGTVDPINIYDSTKVKLVVRGGTFEAHRNGRRREGLAYTQKSFGSGRIGILWGGRVAGIISRLEIVGRIDAAKMAKEMQKGSRA
jgi:hypothetical protein